MDTKNMLVGYPIRETMGANDVVLSDGVTQNVLAPSILIRTQADLAQLPNSYPEVKANAVY